MYRMFKEREDHMKMCANDNCFALKTDGTDFCLDHQKELLHALDPANWKPYPHNNETCTQMRDTDCNQSVNPIEEMKKAGWRAEMGPHINANGDETVWFIRDKPKPNAIVDWDRVENILREFTSQGFGITVETLRNLIKRA